MKTLVDQYADYISKHYPLSESIDATAGVGFGDVNYKFKVSDLIKHAEQKVEGKDKYPVQQLKTKDLAHNLEGREGESKQSEKERVASADTKYPIIVTTRPDGKLHTLDGTHRLQKAIERGDTHIDARHVPLDNLERFRVK